MANSKIAIWARRKWEELRSSLHANKSYWPQVHYVGDERLKHLLQRYYLDQCHAAVYRYEFNSSLKNADTLVLLGTLDDIDQDEIEKKRQQVQYCVRVHWGESKNKKSKISKLKIDKEIDLSSFHFESYNDFLERVYD